MPLREVQLTAAYVDLARMPVRKYQIPNDWRPMPHQLAAWRYLEKGGKRASLVWHRRSGKDSTALNFEAGFCMDNPHGFKAGTIWHMLPTQRQARKVVWEGIDRQGRRIIDQAFPPWWRAPGRQGINNSDMLLRSRNGWVVQLCGSDNYNSLVGSNPLFVVFSEWSLTDPRSWEYVRPILMENGGIAVFIFTPRGYNHGYQVHQMAEGNPKWFAETLTVDDTGVVSPEIIEEARLEGMTEEMIQQEFYCSFEASMPGAYYADVLAEVNRRGGVKDFPEEPGRPVNTYWDLGIDDSTSIVFAQVVGNQFLVIDYEEARGVGLEYYARLLRTKAQERGWAYGTHHWPHDGDHRNLATGMPLSTTARNLGITPLRIIKRARAVEGIQFGRMLCKRSFFSVPPVSGVAAVSGARRLLEALRLYHAEYDEGTKLYANSPNHDWTSHPADAWRTAAMSFLPENQGSTDFFSSAGALGAVDLSYTP